MGKSGGNEGGREGRKLDGVRTIDELGGGSQKNTAGGKKQRVLSLGGWTHYKNNDWECSRGWGGVGLALSTPGGKKKRTP